MLILILSALLGAHASCDVPVVDVSKAPVMTLDHFLDKIVGVRGDYARPVLLRNVPDRWLADTSSACRNREKFLFKYQHLELPLRGDAGLISRTGAPAIVGSVPIKQYINATNPPIVFDASAASDLVPYLVSTGAFAIPDVAGGVLRRTFFEPVFSLGMPGAGLGFHRHAANWLALCLGRKTWYFYHENEQGERPATRGVRMPAAELERAENAANLWRCVQKPGEIMFLPTAMWHATYNEELSEEETGAWPPFTVGIGGIGSGASDAIAASVVDDVRAMKAMVAAAAARAKAAAENPALLPPTPGPEEGAMAVSADGRQQEQQQQQQQQRPQFVKNWARPTGGRFVMQLFLPSDFNAFVQAARCARSALMLETLPEAAVKAASRGEQRSPHTWTASDPLSRVSPDVGKEVRATPLFHAAASGYVDAVRYLLAKSKKDGWIDPHTANQFGQTAMHAAARAGSVDAVRYLAEAGLDARAVDRAGCEPAHFAALHGGPGAVAVLRELARLAAAPLRPSASKSVLGLIPQPEADDDAADEDAPGNPGLPRVDVLEDVGAPAPKPKKPAAAADTRPELLLAKTELGMQPIHFAAMGGPIDALKFLQESGVDIMAQANDGATPLDFALRVQRMERAQSEVDDAVRNDDSVVGGGSHGAAIAWLQRQGVLASVLSGTKEPQEEQQADQRDAADDPPPSPPPRRPGSRPRRPPSPPSSAGGGGALRGQLLAAASASSGPRGGT